MFGECSSGSGGIKSQADKQLFDRRPCDGVIHRLGIRAGNLGGEALERIAQATLSVGQQRIETLANQQMSRAARSREKVIEEYLQATPDFRAGKAAGLLSVIHANAMEIEIP